jgi:transcriptional regulatory protein LevR
MSPNDHLQLLVFVYLKICAGLYSTNVDRFVPIDLISTSLLHVACVVGRLTLQHNDYTPYLENSKCRGYYILKQTMKHVCQVYAVKLRQIIVLKSK